MTGNQTEDFEMAPLLGIPHVIWAKLAKSASSVNVFHKAGDTAFLVVMFQIGQRVMLVQSVSFHDTGACGQIDIELPAGATGTVTDIGDDLNPWIIVRLDQPFACLSEWDNCVTFDQDADGEHGVGVASEYLA